MLVIDTGELDTAPPGWVRVRLNKYSDLEAVANCLNIPFALRDAKGGTELQEEYAIYHDGVCYFIEI